MTTLASGVDGLTKLTSWNNAAVGSGGVVNEVELVYNEFGQITQDRPAHAGAAFGPAKLKNHPCGPGSEP